MTTTLDAWLDDHGEELLAIRKDLHAHPELGFEERYTAGVVARKLRDWGIEVTEGVAQTGVVGVIRGRLPGQQAIGLRADMDALSIKEATGAGHASLTPGLMHACGHDGHTAMLLGAAGYLAANPDFAGTVNLIFQPAEEVRGGARAMIEDGLFERFPCDAMFGLHNSPGLPANSFAICEGPMMAVSDLWEVIFNGVGGHGGSGPHLSTDITYAQAHFVLGLQGIIGRNIHPIEPAVISIGHIQAGSADARNVIPSELVIGGTARSFSDEVSRQIERRIAELAAATAQAWNCRAKASYTHGAGVIVNAPAQVATALAAARAVAGDDGVNARFKPITGSDDFGAFMRLKPGAYMRIGNGVRPDGSFDGLHTPRYDFNDDITRSGVRYWVGLVEQALGAGR